MMPPFLPGQAGKLLASVLQHPLMQQAHSSAGEGAQGGSSRHLSGAQHLTHQSVIVTTSSAG